MSQHKDLKSYEKQIHECVKCGVCHAHCPTYSILKKEGSVARGKVTLASALLEGDIGLEKQFERDISMCLMCGSCMHHCPNKVPVHEIVGAARRRITHEKGLSLLGKSISTLLGSKKVMKNAARAGAVLSSLFFKKIPESSGLRLRVPIPFMENRTLPEPARQNLFERVPEFIQGEPGKPVVGFFAGCAITYLYPEIGESMVSILTRLGCSVHIPASQQCCGLPALSSGNGALMETVAETNIKSLSQNKVDCIVTACASCNSTVGEYYRSMKLDRQGLSENILDFSLFLKQMGLFEKLSRMEKWKKRKKITWHDPCHLKIQGITQEPRELLKSLPNVDFDEMEGADKCCGLGGTFSVYHYNESKAVGLQKIEGLKESGAQFIVTACPGCIMQLQDSINHAGLRIKAEHLLSLLAEALEETR